MWHFIPLILHFHGENIFSLHSHRKWHYVLWIAWILWWSTVLKWCSNVSDFTLWQSNALMRLCHSIPAKCDWQLGFFPGVKQKKQPQEYNRCVENIMFFLREAPFLVVFCWLWGKKVTEKTRGDKRPESKVRKERRSLMKQENTTGQGVFQWQGVWSYEEFSARSEVLCWEDKKRGLTSLSTLLSSVVMSAGLQMDGKSTCGSPSTRLTV